MVVKSKVKYITSLRQKKQRDEDRVFIAEGPRIINELLNEPGIQPQEIFAVREWIRHNSQSASLPVTEIDEVMLSRLSHLTTPNLVLGVFKMPDHGRFDPREKVSLLLENIQDPGNLGSVLRCADWFGISQVVCSRDCVDVYNPKTIQSTMGSIARVKVFYEDLPAIIKEHRSVKVYAATLSGRNINDIAPLEEGMIIIGNESKGISDELLELSSEKITIPKKGRAESLNAAVAAGIILSHLAG